MQIPQLILQRKHRRKSVRLVNIGFGLGLVFSLFVLSLSAGVVLGYLYLVRDLPSIESLTVWLDPQNGRLFQPTRLYDRTGNHLILSLQHPAAGERRYLSLDPAQLNHLPETLVEATLAARDVEFWDHNGYDLAHLITPDMHPTLVQQFVYEILLAKESPSLRRGIRERILAAQVAEAFGKQKILEWYLNVTRYGRYIFGADAAAQVYFAKPAEELTIAESAYLAALTEHPQLDAWDYPQSVVDRQEEIIKEMELQGMITLEQAQAAYISNLELAPEVSFFDFAPAFSAYVLTQIQSRFPGEDFERGGWKITTTLDFDLQQQVQCTVQGLLGRANQATLPGEGQSGLPCQASKLLPSFPNLGEVPTTELTAAVLILDPQNGQVLAMEGDVLTPHYAGTLLSPVVYLAAFSRGTTPGSLLWDIPDSRVETGSSSQSITDYHGPVRARTALVNDYLQPARTLYQQLGENVLQVTANQLGMHLITTPGSPVDYPFLENSLVSLMDVTSSYALYTNYGVATGQKLAAGSTADEDRISPAGVIQLEDIHQVVWLDWSEPLTQPVITSQLAYLMNHVLSDETARWPSLGHPNPLEIGRPAGVKIGRTENHQDSWTVGYTVQTVGGVWIGQSGTQQIDNPATLSAGLWHAIMQYASQDIPVETWGIPPGISLVDICDPSGYLPTQYCPTIVTEVFLNGTEPTQSDILYQPFQINRETGRLATVFTPPELIEDRVYLIFPAEAAEWAKTADLPAPPDAYDVIYSPQSAENAQFTNPEMFAHAHGEVRFQGTASGTNFEYFRLQVGQGLNPQVWTQVEEDSYQSVENGLLGTWDSSGMSGLYAVQLLVVDKDRRVDRAVMQISVDNEPPTIQILNPAADEEIDQESLPDLVLNAQVQDNLVIDRVDFLIDGDLITSLHTAPFYISWEVEPGPHTLQVRAYDLAGNEEEASVQFRVK